MSTTTLSTLGLDKLPPPVKRYFAYVLPQGLPSVTAVSLRQQGELRADNKKRWMTFNAQETIAADDRSFSWQAKVILPLGLHLKIVDSFAGGVGSASVSLLSLIKLANQTGGDQLNSAALMRYLAEGVWCPPALLPQNGVVWSAIDENSALATLRVGDTQVSLEFYFNAQGEVVKVYSPGRYRQTRKGYDKRPWQGSFNDYRANGGFKVPFYGEVGWWLNSRYELVWKGHIQSLEWQ